MATTTPSPVFTLALPGPPVTRSLTWGQLHEYLRSKGWAQTRWGADGSGIWTRGGAEICVYPRAEREDALGVAVRRVAEQEGITAGEMLARIADGEEPQR